MDMVSHEAKSVNPIAKPVGPFLKQEVETTAVSVGQKYVLPAVASEDNVIKSTRLMDAWFPCHAGKYIFRILTCQHGSLTPFLPGSFLPPVDPPGITEREILHGE
jgi:hypothetical protein